MKFINKITKDERPVHDLYGYGRIKRSRGLIGLIRALSVKIRAPAFRGANEQLS